MNNQAAWLSSGRVEALSRVPAVSRAAYAAPVNPARADDLRDIGWLRPDPAAMAAGDVLQFESLLKGVLKGSGSGLPAARATLSDTPWPGSDAPAADRIVSTLRLLSRINGL